ncbi:MAG: anhydro-N-acetylmuramic acid kinase, partial [Winogradskyella sp.]|nr:anhydro-N-acetylmuramic acid kinase [Winogradskyella sp.]
WKGLLINLINKSIEELKEIDINYSNYLAKEINNFINKHKITNIDFVSSHGHTALHQPENGLTYQIGNHQVFAEVLQQKVICDFRVQDVEYGGQGAPLVPIGDRLLFHNYKYCLNLGGFANVSFEKNNERLAFDICPMNIVLNHYVSKLNLEYDDRGRMASTGKVNKDLLAELNQLEFYNQLPPKSLGLEWVKRFVLPLIDSYNLKVEDILRTFIEHIAIQISKVLENQSTSILITGGGAFNDFLIQRLKEKTISNIVIPDNEIVEFKEALVFGLLGVLKERNEINCLKSVTGAVRDHSSGKILFPNT